MIELEQELHAKMEAIKAIVVKLAEQIAALPDNPRIKRLGPRCFILQSKDLDNNWTPSHHDFQIQYEAIIDLIRSIPPENVFDRLRELVKAGTIKRRDQGTIRLHRDVVGHLAKLLGMEDANVGKSIQ